MKNALLFLPFFFLSSCGNHSTDARQIAALQTLLREASHDVARMPIYADPATGDYEDLAKGKFLIQDSAFLEQITNYRDTLESFIVQYIDSTQSFAYLAAYLKYPSAVPALKRALLRKDYYQYYGWERDRSGDTTNAAICNSQLVDHEYPYQLSAIAAIEYITGKPFSQSVKLTPAEEKVLRDDAVYCVPDSIEPGSGYDASCQACWLLAKFKGEPVPHY